MHIFPIQIAQTHAEDTAHVLSLLRPINKLLGCSLHTRSSQQLKSPETQRNADAASETVKGSMTQNFKLSLPPTCAPRVGVQEGRQDGGWAGGQEPACSQSLLSPRLPRDTAEESQEKPERSKDGLRLPVMLLGGLV